MFGRPSHRDEARAQAYRKWFRRRNPFALASFVFGVFSLVEFGVLLVFGMAGIVLGVIALKQLREPGRPRAEQHSNAADESASGAGRLAPDRGHGLAWSGIVLSALSLVIAVVLYSL